LYDRIGLRGLILIIALPLSAAVPVSVLLHSSGLVWAGAVVWGAAIGIHESTTLPADLVPVARRSTRYGIFRAAYGIVWLAV